MASTFPLSTPRSDPTARLALARLPAAPARLEVSIAARLIAAAEQGRVTCPKVRAIVEVFARQEVAA